MSPEQHSEGGVAKCSYCNNTDPSSLLQCRVCKKWFCNSTELKQGSHIYLHLSSAKHKCVMTSKGSRFHGSILRCSVCKENNVFDLRYDSSQKGGVPRLLCISNCLSADCLSATSFDDSKWKPVVADRRFVHQVIPVSQVNPRRDIDLTFELIREFESLKVAHPHLDISQVKPKPPTKLQRVKDDYEDTLEYYNVFEPLLRLEDSEQRQAMQMDGDKHTKVHFFSEEDENKKRFVVAQFDIHFSEYSRDPKQWDELVLTYSYIQDDFDEDPDEKDYKERMKRVDTRRRKARQADESDSVIKFIEDENELDDDTINVSALYSHVDIHQRVEYRGTIMKLESVDTAVGLFSCTMKVVSKQVPREYRSYQEGYYDVRLKEVSSILERRLSALRRLDEEDATHQNIFDIILGNRKVMNHRDFYIPHRERDSTDFNAPNLHPLNPSQRDAVINALTSRMTLIQGPPGTGKTNTAATIVYHLVDRTRRSLPDIPKSKKSDYGNPSKAFLYKKPGPILVTVPSNVAADEICKRINKTGVKVVRLMALSKQDQPSPVEELCVHVKARALMNELYPHQEKVLEKRRRGISIDQKAWSSYLHDLGVCERKVITEAEVVVSTCDSAGSRILSSFKFNTVLIDEASQATEPEVLVPITHGAERVIMVGDQCQLQPVVLSPECKRCNLDRSLFERLINLGQETCLLRVQYRMHPILATFSNTLFYNNRLENGVSEMNRPINPKISYPNKLAPICFWHVIGNETVGGNGSSYMNMTEGKCVIDLAKDLIQSGVKPNQIGIITGYTGQKLLIQNLLRKSNLDSIEFASVNMYQGREKDYIIFSCVRSNNKNTIGFLSDRKRLNVALTRARYGLFVIGNAELLKVDPIWQMYIDYHSGYRSIVEGKIGGWKKVTNI